MRPFRTLLFIPALAFAPFACQTEVDEEPLATGETDTSAMVDPAETEADLDALSDAYVQAYNAHDAAAVAAFYVDDGAQFPPDGPRVKGRAAIERALAEAFEASPGVTISIDTEGRRMATSGDMATAYGTFALSGLGSDAPASEASYQWVASYHAVDGQWKIGGVMWNAGGPAMEAGSGPGGMETTDTPASSP